jgi:AcrR family transcriptional regulator
VQAAIRVLEREGHEAMSLHGVAGELGIKAPSLYHHVAGQEALRRLVAIAGWEAMAAAFAECDVAGEIPVKSVVYAFRRFVLAHPLWYALMTGTHLKQDDPAFRVPAATIMGLFERALAPYGLLGDSLVHGVRTLRAAVHGFLQLELAGQFGMAVPVAETFDWMVDRVLAGLAALQ